MKIGLFVIIAFLVLLMACKSVDSVYDNQSEKHSPAQKLLSKAVKAHGGSLYDQAHYEFVFRDNTYTFRNNEGTYKYTVLKNKDGVETFDQMTNDGFVRVKDGVTVSLSEKQKASFGSSINSVIYFATLPHKLQDPAVNLNLMPDVAIKGKDYHVLQVSFNQEGGGKDHDDTYCYWINKQSYVIDYLAYDFHVNGGGVRFRSAYNTRNFAGILFQDYVNYKAPVGTALSALPRLFEQGTLTKLSVIATEDVRKL